MSDNGMDLFSQFEIHFAERIYSSELFTYMIQMNDYFIVLLHPVPSFLFTLLFFLRDIHTAVDMYTLSGHKSRFCRRQKYDHFRYILRLCQTPQRDLLNKLV